VCITSILFATVLSKERLISGSRLVQLAITDPFEDIDKEIRELNNELNPSSNPTKKETPIKPSTPTPIQRAISTKPFKKEVNSNPSKKASSTTSTGENGMKWWKILIIVLSSVVGLILIISLIFCCCRACRNNSTSRQETQRLVDGKIQEEDYIQDKRSVERNAYDEAHDKERE